jgi:hypothetical protein
MGDSIFIIQNYEPINNGAMALNTNGKDVVFNNEPAIHPVSASGDVTLDRFRSPGEIVRVL